MALQNQQLNGWVKDVKEIKVDEKNDIVKALKEMARIKD